MMNCGNCIYFTPESKHPQLGGCAYFRKLTMAKSTCSKWEEKRGKSKK